MSLARRRASSSSLRLALAFGVAAVLAYSTLHAQIPGRNVNMVSGTTWPTGDPFLQRQNEPSVAASTRNPLHLLGGANDYRTVDVPGLPDGKETGDAWLGLFKSLDGGQRWTSTLLPGYPQDQSAEGLASPLKGYQAGADAVVRASASGMFFFSGLVFDRAENGKSAIFVSRFIDNNNKEAGDPISYLGSSLVATDTGASGRFLDKPWMAVDVPRSNSQTCTVPVPDGKPRGNRVKPKARTQKVASGRVLVAFSAITGDGPSLRSAIYVTISDDCGTSWTKPERISRAEDEVNQGASIAFDPKNGHAYVAWRRFGLTATNDADSIMVARLQIGSKKFDSPAVARKFPKGQKAFSRTRSIFEHRKRSLVDVAPASDVAEFDQGTSGVSFRSNAYPTMAVDGNGRLYVAWSERGFSAVRPNDLDGDARVVMVSTTNGQNFTTPAAVDEDQQVGHQLMPTLTYAGGKLMLVYYDVRETRALAFGQYVSDQITSSGRRQTIDIRAAMGTPGAVPHFDPSVKVSDYLMGFRDDDDDEPEQLQVNPPNLPMFSKGTVPFIGDYIDVTAAPAFLPTKDGKWIYNNAATSTPPVFHAVWTDNRDVRPPIDGNWANYTPVTSPAVGGTSIFDPTAQVPTCVPGNAGSRNQNIYTSRITGGLLAGSPGNSKTLSPALQRGFVVFAQNNTTQTRTFRMSVAAQPVGGRASFTQFPLPPYNAASPPPVTFVDLRVPARSTGARTLYVTSTDPHAQVTVNVQEIGAVGAPLPLPNGLASSVLLNPDIDNPDIDNPDIDNPDIDNPDIDNAEVATPDIDNPDIDNPDIDNPDIDNPDIDNPDIDNVSVANPDIDNFTIGNPDIDNPDIDNPDIDNPDIDNVVIANGSITDLTWTATNTGNTTAAFNVNLFLANAAVPAGIQTQLVLRKTYKTPATSPNGCELKTEERNVLLANVLHPQLITPGVNTVPDQNDPSETNATITLAPGESAKITLRVVDRDRSDNIFIINERGERVSIDPAFDPNTQVTPGIASQAVPSEEAAAGITDPPIITPSGSNLFFLQQPTGAVDGQPIAPAVRVRVFDNAGAVLPGVVVTLALSNNPTGATLTGNVATSGLDGVATFPQLQISGQGTGFVLTASATAGSVTASAATLPFTVASEETPSADLQVTQSRAPISPVTGVPLTYTIVVANNGPLAADSVVLSVTRPAGFDVTNVSGATCQVPEGSGAITCQLGAMAANTATQVTITGTPTQALALVSTATVSSATFDAVPANNVSSDSTFAGAYGVCAVPSLYGVMHTHFGTGTNTNPVAAGDFNGDGFADVAVVSQFAPNSRGLSVMLGTGDGFFATPPTNITIAPGIPQRVAAGDVNNDGNVDLAVTVQNGAAGSVVVLLGNGLGGFTAGVPTPITGLPLEIKAVDVDHDSDLDLIVGNFTTGAAVSLLRGNGEGTFTASTLPGSTDDVIAVADYNGDGHLDLALVAQNLHAMLLLDGDGEGGFAPSVAVPFTDFLSAAHPLADLNGDGRAELVVTTSTSTAANARLLLMTSNASGFNAPVELHPATLLRSSQILNAADLNGDGREDLLVLETPTNMMLVFQNNGLGGFAAPQLFATDDAPSRLVVTDLNADGRPDVLMSVRLQPTLNTWLNTCGGGATADIEATLIAPSTAVAGEIIEGTLTVTNHGPDDATDVRDADGFMPWLVDVDEGVCVAEGGADCDTGNIPVNGVVRFTFHARVLGAGQRLIRSMMTARESDPNPANNMISHTITVSPSPTPVTFTVTSTADFVDGSLREMINQANQNPGSANRIEFNIPGPLPIVFAPLAPLPAITTPMIIDATTQPGYAGTPVVELTGLSAGPGTGLLISGGGSTVRGLAINRWTGVGISISGAGGNFIQGNYVGTDTTGTIARPNNNAGIAVSSAGNTIGGTSPELGNLVSGNGGTGIVMSGTAATGNLVAGNRVGTNAAGTGALPNGNAGVQVITGANNIIGGPTPAHRNLISGGAINGVSLRSGASNNLVQGNYIGVNITGTAALGNGGIGVFIGESSNNTVNGNLISGNALGALNVSASEQAPFIANGNIVTGNRIGTNAAGTGAIPNPYGVFLGNTSTNTTVGGITPGAGNIISGNTGVGVTVTGSSTGNSIRGNSIFGNGFGIDLGGNAVSTPNDPGDADTGPNNLQNFPTIGIAGTGSTIVNGTFNSTPNTAFALDFYSSATCHASGFGEGRTYLGSIDVLTDAAGNAPYLAVLTPTAAAGEYITATATDPVGNTSEFSGCALVSGVVSSDVAVSQTHSPTNPVTNTPFTYTVVVTNNGPATATGVVLTDQLPSTFTMTEVSGASCQIASQTLTCQIGTLPVASPVQIVITGTPTQAQGLENTATVTTTSPDLVSGNNTSVDSTFVGAYGVCSVPSFYGVNGTRYPTQNSQNQFVTGDFNEDDIPDVAALVWFTPTSHGVSVMLGDGQGFFGAPTDFNIAGNVNGITTADFDEDGHLDLALTVNSATNPRVQLLLGNGTGGFIAGPSTATVFNVIELQPADFNHDNHVDLVVTNFNNNMPISLLLGSGNGTFTTSSIPTTADNTFAIADLNGDGHLDIAIAQQLIHAINIVHNDGAGVFTLAHTINFGAEVVGSVLPIADLNDDGRPELAVTVAPTIGSSARLQLYMSDVTGFYHAPVEQLPASFPWNNRGLAAADMNGDGREDLLVTNSATWEVMLLQNNGTGGFMAPVLFQTDSRPSYVKIADINSDGRSDIIISALQDNRIVTLLNTCGGGATADLQVTLTAPNAAVAGDIIEGTLVLTNLGPDTATNFRDADAFISGLIDVDDGVCVAEGGADCDGVIPVNGVIRYTFHTMVLGAGTKVIHGMMTAPESDPNPANNMINHTITVTAAPVTFTVTSTGDFTDGSLRDMIERSNQNNGAVNRIEFNLPGTLPIVISPLGSLPALTVPVVIDGTTQPGYAGTPVVELSGVSAGGGSGLTLFAGSAGSTVRGLAINRWTNFGIFIQSTGIHIEGNFIGTDTTGTIARPNGAGVIALGNGNVIGGTGPSSGNLISGNSAQGVLINNNTGGNRVEGNRIGMNAAGTAVLGNGANGVEVRGPLAQATSHTIGGPSAAHRNFIVGNGTHGVLIRNNATPTVVQNNYFGLNPAGTTALGSNSIGVNVTDASNSTIADNVIVGNGSAGISLFGNTPGAVTGIRIIANRIGINATGSAAIPNNAGISIGSNVTNTVIGGSPATSNLIARNTNAGVSVTGTTSGNSIRVNSIFDNAFGIDLGNNLATANDALDADTGPNNLQNYPNIALAGTGSTIVDGTFSGAPATALTLDFYASAACNGTRGQGERYLGAGNITTDASGNASYHFTLTGTALVGDYISGTATDSAGNTSEFSTCVQVTGAALADLSVTQVHAPQQLVVNQDVTYTLTITNNGPFVASGVMFTDQLPPTAQFVNLNGLNCTLPPGQVSCAIGTMMPGASTIVTIVMRPTEANVQFNNTATVAATGADTITSNNTSLDSSFVSAYSLCAVPTFSGPTTYPIDSTGIGILAKGDFNEDGHIDIAVTETTNQIGILLNDGSGGFLPPSNFSTPSQPTSVIARDFNEDGHLDLVVGAGFFNAWTESLYLGDGHGAFALATTLPQSVSTFNNDAADFNGDGHLDLIATSASTADNVLVVWLGNGNGTFGAPVTYASNNAPANTVIADFDHNGTLDIAVANAGQTTVSVLRGNGNGTFAAPIAYSLPNPVGRLREVGDVDLDGWADLAVTSGPTGTPASLFLLRNDRDGGFLPPTEILGPIGVGFTTHADFNGDGKPDLVGISFQTNQIIVLQGDGDGNFTQVASYLNGPGQNHLAVADLNNDSRPDIIGSLRGQVYTLLNVCAGENGSTVDLSSTITGPANATAGDNLSFHVTVFNNGPDTATGVRVTIPVPTGMSYIGTTGLTCSELFGTVSCQAGPIASDTSVEFDVQVFASGAGARTIRAMATALEMDTEPSNDIGSATTTIAAAPLTYVVTNTTDGNKGSLRWAIGEANNNPGPTNTIAFNIPSGPLTIAPLSALPNIINGLVIDGTTQPGYAGAPIIELTGINTSSNNGLNLQTSNSTIRGLVINRWGTGINMGSSGGNNAIEGNYIGTNVAGTAPAPNNTGVQSLTPNNRIGGNTAAQRNVISGNAFNNVNVSAGVTNGVVTTAGTGTLVIGNYIGTNAAGTAAIISTPGSNGVRVAVNNVIVGTPSGPNVISGNAGAGVVAGTTTPTNTNPTLLTDATGLQVRSNFIGTNAAGTGAIPNGAGFSGSSGSGRIGGTDPADRNVIAGNTSTGVFLGIASLVNNTVFVSQASGYVIEGNVIGLSVSGAALPNGGNGVQLSASNNTVGGATAASRNIISSNGGIGVQISNVTTPVALTSANNLIIGNYVGLDPTGTIVRGNGLSGITSSGGVNNVGVGNSIIGNVVTGNGSASTTSTGVGINLNGGSGHKVQGNFVGTDPAGTAAMPNAFGGVIVALSNNNLIGGPTAAERNIISGNGTGTNTAHGILVNNSANGNIIAGNYIGVDATGAVALPNRSNGINIGGTSANTLIGSPNSAAGNLISGNGGSGILTNSGAGGVTIQGNRIGTNAAGTAAIPNLGSGIQGNSNGLTIGGINGAGNLISGNGTAAFPGHGVSFNNSNNHLVVGNLIGTNVTGTAAIPNRLSGVILNGGSGSTIGGSVATAGNIISGNGNNNLEVGIALFNSNSNTIQGNRVGTNMDGTAAIPNQNGGIHLNNSNNNTIGGPTALHRNQISGNGAVQGFGVGVSMFNGSTGNLVLGNFIGTDAAGTAGLPNLGNGVAIDAANNVIGGTAPGLGNRIGFNTINGVNIGFNNAYTGNMIRGNAILSNTNLGIDVGGGGVTPNDLGDADVGPNNFQNFPVITAAVAGASTSVGGSINTNPSTDVSLDFYVTLGCDPSGFGEGPRYLGSTNVTTDASGNATFQVVLQNATAAGNAITATATTAGGTSEFSACFVAQ